MQLIRNMAVKGERVLHFLLVGLVALAASLLVPGVAFAQGDPVGQIQSAATNAATSAVGLIVAVMLITLAVAFAIWAVKRARGGA